MIAEIQPQAYVRDMFSTLYTTATGKTLPIFQMAFSVPTHNPNSAIPKNSRLVLVPILGSGRFSTVTLYYNRIDFSELLEDVDITLVDYDVYSNLTQLTEFFGITITEDDVENTVIDNTGKITLIAKPTSYLYTGTKTVNIVGFVPVPT